MRAIQDIEEHIIEIPQSIQDLRSVVSNRCNRLIQRVKTMAENPTSELDPSLSPSQRDSYCADFFLLNKVHHHTALLEMYQRVLDKPQTDCDVQVEVESGLRCLKHLALTKGSTPGVAALHSIFIIGCSATTAENRSFVMDWLENMRLLYCMGNVPTAKLFLFELWQRNDALKAVGSHIQWDKFMLEKNMDLSLY
ncbi:c6 finger domain-containing, variant [Trichoderma arundinaceum]|uniref:C6 finger domain-containing, variant n=1 Tax=Trichoderma arundinaceum TaxID=490622 RepID=A0A395NS44_TRIAR|nr:c6 finger domain-containing, variant [Trichoderma arundinaceum]